MKPDMRLFILATVLVASVSATAADRVCKLKLAGALPDERDIDLHLRLRDGRALAAFAQAEKYNQISYAVDAEKLRLGADDRLSGELVISITSDGYVPPPGCTDVLRCTVGGRVTDGQLIGTFTGTFQRTGTPSSRKKRKREPAYTKPVAVNGVLSGSIAAPPSWGRAVRFALRLNAARAQPVAQPGKKAKRAAPWTRPGFLRFTTSSGRADVAMLRGVGGHPINYFQAEVLRTDLRWQEGRLLGSVHAVSNGRPYRYVLDGKVIGDSVAGSFTRIVDGQRRETERFHGTLEDVSDVQPTDAVWYLVLDNAIIGDKQMILHLPIFGEGFRGGVGFAGKFNHTWYEVDSSELRFNDGRLTGPLGVTILPDPYVPADGKPIPCSYHVDALVADGSVTGVFGGTCGDETVQGQLSGELRRRPPLPEPVKINVKLDDGAAGTKHGPPWHRRCYLGFVATDGKATEGRFSNNKGGFKGHFVSADVDCDGAQFNATIHAVVDESRSVQVGPHKFILKGKVIGGEIVGTVETIFDGKPWKKDTAFIGYLRPVE